MVELILSDNLSVDAVEEVYDAYDLYADDEFYGEVADLLILYIRSCLADHRFSSEQEQEIIRLKQMFELDDEFLYQYRPGQVEAIVVQEVDAMLDDSKITRDEDLHQGHLQRALGLSYDEFVEFAEPHANRLASELSELMRWSSSDERQELYSQLRRLRAVFLLPPSAEEIDVRDEASCLPGRRQIPVRVKREVWNRDGAQCSRCGSSMRLEYDHIIPVSRGGSSTARNIQLLCEECNRKKSNNLGLD